MLLCKQLKFSSKAPLISSLIGHLSMLIKWCALGKTREDGSGEDRQIPSWLSNHSPVANTKELLSGLSASAYL